MGVYKFFSLLGAAIFLFGHLYSENNLQGGEINMNREKVLEENAWNLTSFFKTKADWKKKLDELITESDGGFLKIKKISFDKDTRPEEVRSVLISYFEYMRDLDMLYTFAHLKHDEDLSFTENKESYERALSLYHRFQSAASWIEPAILQIDPEFFEQLLTTEELSSYCFYLKKLQDQKAHILSSDKEEIMSLSSRMQGTASGAFSALTNVDLNFGVVKDGEGKEVPLTNSSYGKYLKMQDRALRKNAFEKLHTTYATFENTLAELLHGKVQSHIFNAKVRSYENSLEAALKPHNIPISVYHNLIDTISSGLEPMHRYVSLRKKLLGVDELYAYDLYVPLMKMEEKHYSFKEACEIVIESVAILGKEYQDVLRKGLLEDRWVDIYENKGKRSGAYSSGCYDSNPYILMNFQGTLNDVLTLSHEAGHSMNTYLSNQKQSYHDAGYTIFVAEVASTFNEQLTYDYLYKKAETKEERIFLLTQQLDAIRATFFRQTLFAEFELKIHEMAENHIPLTPDNMKKVYGELNKKYYGEALTSTDKSSVEYLRIPHFYYNFYVYQYATGIAAAITLVDKVRAGGLAPYMGFLEAGGSKYSIDILKAAGADMTSKEPIENTLKIFSILLEKLEKEFEIN